MASQFPLPVRVVAGALAAGFERLQHLPAELPELSVTIAGHAMRTSMRLQQEIAQLATRGEEVLASFGEQPEEHPAWARFDDEEVPADPAEAAARAEPPAADLPMAEYDDLRLAQVRARMRTLTADEITQLLEYERARDDRAAFVTMLENRLTTLAADPAPDRDAGSSPTDGAASPRKNRG